jgi:GTP pyrophosphokinase
MDEIAEKGYAAHWKYKESGQNNDNGLEAWIGRVREILEHPEQNALEFLDDFKLTLYSDEIFIFTPKGDLRKLPAFASVLDFAFEIHTDVGLKCIGAKLNNKLVPINHTLSNGDQVEILTSIKQKPTEEWLNLVVTAKAKAKIREYFKQQKLKTSGLGKEILERKFKNAKVSFTSEALSHLIRYFKLASVGELYYQIATEKIDRTKIDIEEIINNEINKPALEELSKPKKVIKKGNDAVIIGDEDTGMDYSFAKCCNPIPGDEIFGFVTIGEGVKIHRTNCSNATGLMSNYGYRIIRAKWANESLNIRKSFVSSIKVEGIDSVGIVSTITDIISKQLQINMKSISITSNAGSFEGMITLEIMDTQHLEELMQTIKDASPFITVRRVEDN